jgi:hypothetical protein
VITLATAPSTPAARHDIAHRTARSAHTEQERVDGCDSPPLDAVGKWGGGAHVHGGEVLCVARRVLTHLEGSEKCLDDANGILLSHRVGILLRTRHTARTYATDSTVYATLPRRAAYPNTHWKTHICSFCLLRLTRGRLRYIGFHSFWPSLDRGVELPLRATSAASIGTMDGATHSLSHTVCARNHVTVT